MPSESPIIKFQNVDKFYGNFQALSDISIEVKPSERMVICGPSGSGKSTLIRCINGLESHSMGKLTVDGIEVYEGSKEIISLRQNVGMVFQQFNLFPHLT
ncbi:MAG: ATP-binding cassette domain-containing protein, partial [Paracoccaceae bacterium]|nr:ATP-binding cassette domain-containing protein [Paracoccaceae bacterium]